MRPNGTPITPVSYGPSWFGLAILVGLFAFTIGAAQERNGPPSAESNAMLVGCLDGGILAISPEFVDNPSNSSIVDKLDLNTNDYVQLSGKPLNLESYDKTLVRLSGTYTKSGSAGRILMRVKSVALVHRPTKIPPTLGNAAHWHTHTNQKYAFRIRYPSSFQLKTRYTYLDPGPNLTNLDEVETLFLADVPRSIYPNKEFYGGTVGVYVNRAVSDASACKASAGSSGKKFSTVTIGGITYWFSESGNFDEHIAHAWNVYRSYYTYQNRMCYKLGYAWAEGSPAGLTCPYGIDFPSGDVARLILRDVSFLTPSDDRVR